MNYKVTFKNRFRSVEAPIYLSLLLSVAGYYLFGTERNPEVFTLVFAASYLVILLPALFLHLDYYFKNKNKTLRINAPDKTISFNEESPISFNDIERVVLVLPPIWQKKWLLRLLPFQEYHFARIWLKNGRQFVFTSLMTCSVENALGQLTEVPVEKIKSLFATTLL